MTRLQSRVQSTDLWQTNKQRKKKTLTLTLCQNTLKQTYTKLFLVSPKENNLMFTPKKLFSFEP